MINILHKKDLLLEILQMDCAECAGQKEQAEKTVQKQADSGSSETEEKSVQKQSESGSPGKEQRTVQKQSVICQCKVRDFHLKKQEEFSYSKLEAHLMEMVSDYSLIAHFYTSIKDMESIYRLKAFIDKATGRMFEGVDLGSIAQGGNYGE